MSDNVLDRVFRQCRDALLGGTPIIYIKTDSDVFIEKLLLKETSPLVVLLSNGGRKGCEEEQKLREMRPIYEIEDIQSRQLRFCRNYSNSLPNMDSSGVYTDLYFNKSPRSSLKNMESEKVVGPYIWSYKMPDDITEQNRLQQKIDFSKLEHYVTCHENPGHPQYEVLRRSVVILYSDNVYISPMLRSYTAFIDVEYPDMEEIRTIIKTESAGDLNLLENDEYLSVLCTDFSGFTTEEIILTMRKIVSVSSLEKSDEVEKIINEYKRQKMQGGILEQCSDNSNIGGMDKYREWLDGQIKPLKNSNSFMRKIGTPPPKGVLLCGIPGCGKSEAAKFTAKTLGLPLLKMDIGSLMDKYQGVSEQRMRDALKMAEAMSPCVLWIDELEKGFSGAGSDGDSSSFKRMFGYMLGWMQDNKKPCFIFATANDIGGLPKEFFRSGRFDALFAVYLPTADECVDIFMACMDKAKENIAKARHLRMSEITLFSSECYSETLLKKFVNECFVDESGRPRIAVGSDIQKIVNLALRRLSDVGTISGEEWDKTLCDVISEPTFNMYGDGEENVDSIAVGYCRMLRKGFIPTSSEVLFNHEDYHMEYVEEYDRLKRTATYSMSKDDLQNHKKRLSEYEILQKNDTGVEDRYNKAVYSYLRTRINEIAVRLEMNERQLMIRR